SFNNCVIFFSNDLDAGCNGNRHVVSEIPNAFKPALTVPGTVSSSNKLNKGSNFLFNSAASFTLFSSTSSYNFAILSGTKLCTSPIAPFAPIDNEGKNKSSKPFNNAKSVLSFTRLSNLDV